MILQEDTEISHVSKFPLLLYSQPAGLRLLAELLTSGVEDTADILADVRDFVFDAFEVLPLLHRATSSLVFQRAVCDTIHLIQYHKLTLLDVRVHPFLPALPLYKFRWPVQLQHELHQELLAHILELLLQSLLLGSLRRCCLAPACKHVALPTSTDDCERSLPLCSHVYFSREGLMTLVHKQLALRKDFEAFALAAIF